MNGIEAMIAICANPEARIIVLTTYKGEVQVLRALKPVLALIYWKGLLRRSFWRRFGLFMPGKSVFAGGRAQLADHVADDTLHCPRNRGPRLIAAGDAQTNN